MKRSHSVKDITKRFQHTEISGPGATHVHRTTVATGLQLEGAARHEGEIEEIRSEPLGKDGGFGASNRATLFKICHTDSKEILSLKERLVSPPATSQTDLTSALKSHATVQSGITRYRPVQRRRVKPKVIQPPPQSCVLDMSSENEQNSQTNFNQVNTVTGGAEGDDRNMEKTKASGPTPVPRLRRKPTDSVQVSVSRYFNFHKLHENNLLCQQYKRPSIKYSGWNLPRPLGELSPA